VDDEKPHELSMWHLILMNDLKIAKKADRPRKKWKKSKAEKQEQS
jgi:hypothetical protein